MEAVELFQFLYSPYNEKIRFALDWKGVPHRRTSLLPGPHALFVRRRTGQTKTPVVRFGSEFVHGSARILAELERRFPDPPLRPEGEPERRRALEIERWLDEDVVPRGRRAVLAAVLGDAGYVSRMFGAEASGVARTLYAATFPLARGLIRRGNGIAGPESIEDGLRAGDEAFDFVARESAATGFLVGSAFSHADLVAAALLAPFADVGHPDMARPRPFPGPLESLVGRWRDHPGRAWLDRIYRHHRPTLG